MNPQNVNVNTATPESPKTCSEGPEVNTGLTEEQFEDLSKYIIDNGTFCGPGGVTWQELALFEEIDDPSVNGEPRRIYVWQGWPYALYEFDLGYTAISYARTRELIAWALSRK
ncbi:hypothetical protein PMPD1_4419 (plasmid) [Paramixta manurensis]|uniref:Uncharacterized protein n=1 Tax=Paramixta manurensis TaxID=2740817 RepID=A0A6M8ULI8_9GAMM|nr:hypothetical protein PMPD1_4419 [Erwiniaceae bacterium PD-1]